MDDNITALFSNPDDAYVELTHACYNLFEKFNLDHDTRILLIERYSFETKMQRWADEAEEGEE